MIFSSVPKIMIYYISFSSLAKYFHTIAAIAAPTSGPTINTQTWDKASPPTKIAGAKLLAGLTDVPVRGIPIKCTNVNVRPITIPAIEDFFSSDVTPKIV